MNYLAILGVIIGVIALFNGNDSKAPVTHTEPSYIEMVQPSYDTYTPSSYSNYYNDGESEEKTIDRDEAISEHWDEIKDYVNGNETIESCSSSGCYDLDADISNGNIDTVNFPNGGYLSPDEPIDENGSASSFDNRGNSWDYNLDMNSGVVDDAVQEWADDNGYEIQ